MFAFSPETLSWDRLNPSCEHVGLLSISMIVYAVKDLKCWKFATIVSLGTFLLLCLLNIIFHQFSVVSPFCCLFIPRSVIKPAASSSSNDPSGLVPEGVLITNIFSSRLICPNQEMCNRAVAAVLYFFQCMLPHIKSWCLGFKKPL